MIRDILTAAGIIHRQARFTRPPAETYAVYFDDVTTDAPDPVVPPFAEGLPRVYTHDVSVELYEPEPDDAAEAAIEAAIDAQGLPWTKQARYWLQDAQRYQVVYSLTYTTKKGG